MNKYHNRISCAYLLQADVTGSNGGHSDPFFAHHESIMKCKTAEEIGQMRAAIKDIQSAVTGRGERPITDIKAGGHGVSTDNTSQPIWEIRYHKLLMLILFC